ncbi:radical SAM family heme chaperone HemW [Sulfidibacter corallicola]|uniref:Heme chaperone HemW n=1 Tax=Sulfidibacter corallicola TaxID=2818388 RepID=A0A8A4TUE2_SULCO|nr:radical SAM family heme chaperone HemW [Sulfidibacter corallicola]QTD52754.1 radical SAM family heme chaperone HemW [Sulfidibacter corallicola]
MGSAPTKPIESTGEPGEASPVEPLAIYLHVPFCGQRCAYCHFEIKVFHPSSGPGLRDAFVRRYVAGLAREIETYAPRFRDREVGSLFFGGGTPSRLDLDVLAKILECVKRRFDVREDAEISIEVNPEDGTRDYLNGLRALGFTRLSFGVQTFDDRGLRAIGRPHDGAGALRVLGETPAFPHGVSVDLMLGLPFQNRETLERDLNHIEALALGHLSVYMLETDLPTPLDKTGRDYPMPDADAQAESYEHLCVRLAQMGLVQYEISNFARDGLRCRHNSVYWRCGDYLGLGPAAHGRTGLEYRANHARLGDWFAAVEAHGLGVAQTERWSPERLRRERLVQGFRLNEGVPASWISPEDRAQLSRCETYGLVWCRDGRCGLTAKGRLLGNEVFQIFVARDE